jgi:ABC-type antimicrobial peptide transport system permease subunit
MIVNFFKTILREFKSNKTYTAIKVLGLAFGIACAIVIISFVINMMSFNNMHEKGDRIYQAFHRSMYKNTGENISGTVSAKLAPALKQEIPEIRNSVTVNDISDVLFIVNENRIKESGVYSDESLFSIFTFPVISQMSDSIFNGPNSIAISESLAKKLFGNIDNVLGHSVLIRQSNSKKELTVSSIFRDIPDNSTIRFEFVLPIREYLKEHSRSNHWGNMFANAYVELNEKADINTLNKKLQNFIKEHKENSERELFLFPFTKVFLEHPQGAVKSITIIEVMLIIGLGILIIACINYINIAVSQSSKKAREVGLRKAIGSNRKSLIFRFLGESFVITVISIIFAVGIAEILFSILSESIREISVMYIPYNN